MRKYARLFLLSLSEALAYRTNVFLEMGGTAVLMFFTIAIWKAFYSASGAVTIRGYTLQEMVVYLLLGAFFAMTILHSSEGDDVNDEINDGSVSLLLVKPIAPPLYWFVRDCGRRLVQLSFGVVVLGIFGFNTGTLFIGIATLQSIFFAMIFFGLSSVLHFLMFFSFSVIAFWLEQTWGERFLIRVMLEIAGGLFIPLSLFPPFWHAVFSLLPFKFFIYVPVQIVLGKVSGFELLELFGHVGMWVLFFWILSTVFWYRGVRHYDGVST